MIVLGAIAAGMAVRADLIAPRLWRRSGSRPEEVTARDVTKVRVLYVFAAALGVIAGLLLIVF